MFASYWCHGAPGIGLSFIRALQLTNDPTCAHEAMVAVATTQETIKNGLETGGGNYSLCHGLAGNTEVLRYAQRVTTSVDPELEKVVQRVAEAGITFYSDADSPWPVRNDRG